MKTTLLLFFTIMGMACSGTGLKEAEHSTNTKKKPSQRGYFEMKEEDVIRFSEKVKGLRLGDSLDKVLSILGEPDEGPYTPGKQATGVLVKKRMSYNIKIKRLPFKSPLYDKWVELYFDSEDRLMLIDSTAESIINRGSPTEPLP